MIGATGTFTLSVTGPDANSLTAADFVSQPSSSGEVFVVRFRGFADGGSDKVPGEIIPAPSAMCLLGFAGLAATRRRR